MASHNKKFVPCLLTLRLTNSPWTKDFVCRCMAFYTIGTVGLLLRNRPTFYGVHWPHLTRPTTVKRSLMPGIVVNVVLRWDNGWSMEAPAMVRSVAFIPDSGNVEVELKILDVSVYSSPSEEKPVTWTERMREHVNHLDSHDELVSLLLSLIDTVGCLGTDMDTVFKHAGGLAFARRAKSK